jgi:radical SAM protein (TIGR04043 family)
MDIKKLSVDLQSLGVQVPEELSGRNGGAGPSEGRVLILDGHYINVPTQSWFVRLSPYRIDKYRGKFFVFKKDEKILEIGIPSRPLYYSLKTDTDIPLEKIALLHGRDCIGSTVYQDCVFWNTDSQCKFCGIGVSLASGSTVFEKTPFEIGYAAEKAKLLDKAKHVTLTMGKRAAGDNGTNHLLHCIQEIKLRSGLPVHIQIMPPLEKEVIVTLKKAGADTAGIHIETCNMEILKQIAPCKAEIGLAAYIKCWEQAVSVFGRNQVSSFIIAGIGDTPEEIFNGVELLSELGVYPYVLPLRPVRGTFMEKWKPPQPDEMILIYEKVCGILKRHNLSSRLSKAGCVRCGACSSISFFEKD